MLDKIPEVTAHLVVMMMTKTTTTMIKMTTTATMYTTTTTTTMTPTIYRGARAVPEWLGAGCWTRWKR